MLFRKTQIEDKERWESLYQSFLCTQEGMSQVCLIGQRSTRALYMASVWLGEMLSSFGFSREESVKASLILCVCARRHSNHFYVAQHLLSRILAGENILEYHVETARDYDHISRIEELGAN